MKSIQLDRTIFVAPKVERLRQTFLVTFKYPNATDVIKVYHSRKRALNEFNDRYIADPSCSLLIEPIKA